jgi:hypothetical protein
MFRRSACPASRELLPAYTVLGSTCAGRDVKYVSGIIF